MAGVIIGAIVGSAVSDAVGAYVADAVLGTVIDSGITAAAADALGASIATANFIGGAAGLVAGGLASVATQVVLGGGMNAPSQAQSAVSSAQAQGILINSQSNVDPIPVIYGRRRVGGTRVFIEVSGTNHEYLHLVVVLGEGPVASIDNVYLDNVLSTDAKFSGLVTINKHLGTSGDPVDATLTAAVPKWNSTCTLSGCAYLYVQLKYDSNAFSGLPNITADVRGRTLYDPRDTGTRWSTNAALAVRDYLTNSLYGRGIASSSIDDTSFSAAANACEVRVTAPSYSDLFTADGVTDTLTFSQSEPIDTGDGVRVSSTLYVPSPLAVGTTYYAVKITDTTYKLATTVANAMTGVTIDLLDGGSGTMFLAHWDYATYTSDGTVDTSNTAYQNIKALLTACRGMLVFSAGKYRLVLDQLTTASGFGFTESNITGSWVITQAGKRTKFNRVTAGFYNPAKMWQPDLAMVESTALRAVDNGLLLESKVDLPFTANIYRALNISQLTLNQSRYGLVVKFSAFQEGLRCEVGDVVPITHSTPGWSAKLFRILQIELKDSDEVTILAQEYDASVYTLANLSPAAIIPRSNLPDPFTVPMITGLTLTSGTSELLRLGDGSIVSRIKAAWNLPADIFAQKGQIEIQSKKSADSYWNPATTLAADLTASWIAPVQDGVSYDVRVRSVNTIGVRGIWVQSTVIVVGKTAPPANVASATATVMPDGVLLTWSAVSDADLAQYEVRVGGASFLTAMYLATAKVTQLKLATMAAGTYTWRIKAVDSSGNYSTSDITASAVIAAPAATTVSYLLAGTDEVLSWAIPSSSFTVDRYEIRYGASWAAGTVLDSTKATSYRRRVDYSGSRTYWVAAIDTVGNVGVAASVAASIVTPGGVTSLRADVVDNNALIYWGVPATGNLPVDRYEARKGSSWASGTTIGSNGNSTFTTVFEQQSGTYTYWVSAVDSAGNFGPAASVAAFINQPPDYVLRANLDSSLAGTKVNAVLDGSTLLLPVDASQTWTSHFTGNAWATAQDQINAGYPLYIEPALTTASYTEDIDYGSTLPATNITVTLNSTLIVGAVAASCQIKYKLNVGDAWTLASSGATSALVSNFRYVQIVYTFSAAGGTNLLRINNLNVKLSVKQRTDSGSGTAAVGGTSVTFGYPFLSADTPIVQPNGSTPLIPVVIYVGGVNPTGFTVRLYNTSGTDVGGAFSWSVRGY